MSVLAVANARDLIVTRRYTSAQAYAEDAEQLGHAGYIAHIVSIVYEGEPVAATIVAQYLEVREFARVQANAQATAVSDHFSFFAVVRDRDDDLTLREPTSERLS